MRISRRVAALALGLVPVSCQTSPAYDRAQPLEAATSMAPPAGRGAVVGRLKVAISESPQYHAGDGLLLIGSDGKPYRLRTDREGWFCVWLPVGRYQCESVVAYLGRPEWPVLATLPRNEFEVVDQEVGYLGTLRTTARVEEADLGYGLWMVVQDFRVVDEAANASRELAAKYGSPPPFRTALLVLEEPQ